MIAMTMTNIAITIRCGWAWLDRTKLSVVGVVIDHDIDGEVRDRVPYPRMWSSLEYVLTPTIANMLPSVNDVTDN